MQDNVLASFLVLDFRKMEETRLCLESIKRFANFPKKVIYLDNGSNEDYVSQLYNKGLCDVLIRNKENGGLGLGTLDLFRFCPTKYAFYVQNDQFLMKEITHDMVLNLIGIINNNSNIKMIGLAGNHCGNNTYSERAHFVDVEFYNSIPNKPFGGAGPYHNYPWIEGYIQKYLKDNNYYFPIFEPWFGNNGKWAIRQNPDGSIWKHSTDSKKLKLISGLVKEKFVYPKFSDKEWETVLRTQTWPDYQIPENEIKDSFICWPD